MGLYDTTIGTLLVGVFFNTFLYGIVTYQFAGYYRTKFNDRPALKYAVLFLFILDTFHTASTIYMTWDYTVTNFGDPDALVVDIWPYSFTPVAVALAALVTYIYLAIRIRRLTSSNLLYGVAMLLAIVSFILGVITTTEGWTVDAISEISHITPLVIAWLSLQVVVDAFITATLVIIFSRSRTGFRKTDTILNRLIRGTIQTGLFASIFSLATLIFFVILPDTNLCGMFAIPIGRVYTNTLMDTLLYRELLMAETDYTGSGNLTQSIVIDSMCPTTHSQATPTAQSTSTDAKSHPGFV